MKKFENYGVKTVKKRIVSHRKFYHISVEKTSIFSKIQLKKDKKITDLAVV